MFLLTSKLVKELKTPWVREFIVRDGSRVNCLLLISDSIESMIAANEIFWSHSLNGKDISLSPHREDEGSITEIFKSFFKSLKRKFNREKKLTNLELIKFTAVKRFCAKHTRAFLDKNIAKSRQNPYLN